MLFALCFFHALALGRRKFGYQGFSRAYPFNNGDITVCAQVMLTLNLTLTLTLTLSLTLTR